MNNQKEYEIRCKAIQLYNEGLGFNKILNLVRRSGFWVSKWLKGIKNRNLLDLKTEAVHPRESGEKPLSVWLERFFLSGKKVST